MPDQVVGKLSPLEEISVGIFKGKTFPRETVVTVGTSRVVLLENNPNRLAWQVINESVSDVRLSTDATITAATGWLLQANGGVVDSVYYDDGEAVAYQVFAISGVAGNSIRVREIVRS